MTAKSNYIEPIVIERLYKHPVNKVFNAFSNKESFKQWIAPSVEIKTKILLQEFYVGGRYRIEFIVPEAGVSILSGEYVHIKHLQQICFTWIWEEPDIHAGINSLVTADFLEYEGFTKLTITHEKLSTPKEIERHTRGWNASLGRLNNLFE